MDLFRHDAAWDVLKRALRSRQARIENLAEMMDRSQAVTIQARARAADVKIVLFGEAWVYQRLCQFDPEFAGLFKVQATSLPPRRATTRIARRCFRRRRRSRTRAG